MYAVFKRELFSLLNSLMAYITIGVFLLAAGLLLWFFPDTSILAYGYAELTGFFSLSPFLFIFLIPAITMRSFAEERREDTYVLLATRPLRSWEIILGKYLACFVLLVFTLLPTLVYYYSVYELAMPLGNVDSGAIIGSYLGLLLLGSVFVAIGIFASSITKNQVVAFAIAVFICFITYSGFDALGQIFSGSGIERIFTYLSINEHYQSMSRGVLDTRDLSYFLTLIAVFLGLTSLTVGRFKWGFLLVLLFLNIVTAFAYTRFDFTKEKRFTLTDKTRELLKKSTKEFSITVFLDGDMPAAFKRLQQATRDLLNDYKAYNAEVKVTFVDPLSGLPVNEQDTVMQHLYAIGIEATNLNIKNDNGFEQKTVFPMALVQCDGRQIAVKLLQNQDASGSYEENINNSIQNLEYSFTSAIRKVVTGINPRIGFTEGNGELSDLQLSDAMKSLSDSYEVGRVNLQSITRAGLDKLKLLVVAKPQQEFTEAEKYKLNYFISRGGSVVWSIDQVSADLDSLKGKGEQLAFNKKLNLDDMLFTYGARVNYNLLADANCVEIPLAMSSGGSQSQIQMAPWVYYPLLLPDSTNSLVKNIDALRAEFVSTVDTIGVKGIVKKVILRSSAFNKLHAAPKLLSLQMVAEQPDPREYASTPQPVAVLLEGEFPSVFMNRAVPEGITEPYEVPAVSKRAKMIVIGDGDLFKNQISTKDNSIFPLGFDRYTQNNYGNKVFLLNVADYLCNEESLISLRNKELKVRLLNKVLLREEKSKWQLVNVLVPLLLLISFSIFQHYYRRHKYAR
ncbi:gliding motility-associated ABC transporter substrate-binding protein GldG [Pedobacter sp. MC2016-14]|uniref:gliding motility-associated ABC transporter substrate-binding protein GldG n=1 Tax=Pedobacter sp. MC2016-14 TaxID=2897327 RepID=UPI0021046A4C|nr:gliding motility-associated ABC transporter substrate-binding protein GldG [Pedobacter sp. MC2016-14]